MLAFCLIALDRPVRASRGTTARRRSWPRPGAVDRARRTGLGRGASAGGAVIQRFTSLVTTNPAQLYYESRGGFVQEAFERRPLGATRWATAWAGGG